MILTTVPQNVALSYEYPYQLVLRSKYMIYFYSVFFIIDLTENQLSGRVEMYAYLI